MACWLRLECWSNYFANSHPSPGAFNRRVLRSCLVPQGSYPHYRPRHQRRLAVTGCFRLTPTDNLPILAGIQPAELRRNGVTLSLERRPMEPGRLFQSALTCPPSADARRLKSRHPFVPVTQQLISLSDNNNIRAAQWADGSPMECGVGGQPCKTPYFHHRHPPSRNDSPKKSLGPAQPPPHRCRTFPLLPVQMGYGLLCGL